MKSVDRMRQICRKRSNEWKMNRISAKQLQSFASYETLLLVVMANIAKKNRMKSESLSIHVFIKKLVRYVLFKTHL